MHWQGIWIWISQQLSIHVWWEKSGEGRWGGWQENSSDLASWEIGWRSSQGKLSEQNLQWRLERLTGEQGEGRRRKRHKSGKRAVKIRAENDQRDAWLLVFCVHTPPPTSPDGPWADGMMGTWITGRLLKKKTVAPNRACWLSWEKEAKKGAVQREWLGNVQTRRDGLRGEGQQTMWGGRARMRWDRKYTGKIKGTGPVLKQSGDVRTAQHNRAIQMTRWKSDWGWKKWKNRTMIDCSLSV